MIFTANEARITALMHKLGEYQEAVKLCSAKDRPSSGCKLDVASQD